MLWQSIAVYMLRGVIVAYIIERIIESLTGYPGYSIAIIYGLFLIVPFSTLRYMVRGLVLVLGITLIHIVHTIFLHYYNPIIEFLVVVTSWSTLLWWNTVERWKAGKTW